MASRCLAFRLATHCALRASAILGVVLALWYPPLFAVPGAPQGQVPFFLLFVVQAVALSVFFALVYNGGRRSLPLVLLLHASVNTWAGVLRLPRASTGIPSDLDLIAPRGLARRCPNH